MSKKLLISLAPLAVTAAFAVMPASALAVPHAYQNGSKIAEAEPLPTISWGNIKLTNATLGEVECHNAVGGVSENPAGGGAAVGKVESFNPYSCVAEGCASLGGKIKVLPEKLPWAVEVIEESGVFRNKTTGVNVTIDCEGVISVLFHGENKPKAKNGSAIGSKPSEAEFDEGSGSLESEVGPGKTGGKLVVQGYKKEEVIAIKNP